MMHTIQNAIDKLNTMPEPVKFLAYGSVIVVGYVVLDETFKVIHRSSRIIKKLKRLLHIK